MKKEIPNDEIKLKAMIDQYTVPVSDEDWNNMAALLDGQDKGGGGVPLPDGPATGPAANRSFRKWTKTGLLLLLLTGIVYGTVAGLFKGKRTVAQATQEKAAREVSKNDGPIQSPQTLENGQQEAQNSVSDANASVGAPKTRSQHHTAEHPNNTFPIQPANQSSSDGALGATNKRGGGGLKGTAPLKRQSERHSREVQPDKSPPAYPETGLASSQAGPNASTMSPKTDATLAPPSPPLAVEETAVPHADAPNTLLLALLQGRPITGVNMSDTLYLPPNPVATPPRRLPKYQRGWILGANANMVRYSSGKMSTFVQAGYHVSRPLYKHFRLQAELQAKYVTNYGEKASFQYATPIGTSVSIEWGMNNLLFVELPILLKKMSKTGGKTAWLLGLKPAYCAPVFPRGAYSIFTSGSSNGPTPNVDLTLRQGVRPFDIGLVWGMEWRFSKRWAIDLRYSQGFLDMTHDNFFKNTATHLNSDIQFTFRHYVQPFKLKRHVPTTLYPVPFGVDARQ